MKILKFMSKCYMYNLNAPNNMTSLEQLKKLTVVVSDSGEYDLIAKYKPQDATTNPSLLYKASQLPAYKPLVTKAIEYAKKQPGLTEAQQVELAMDKLSVLFGVEILKLIGGRVSTEIDARLSFDTEGTIARCLVLARLYEVMWRYFDVHCCDCACV